MIDRGHWTTDLALRYFQDRAELHTSDFEARYGWTPHHTDEPGHDEAEVEAIYDEVIAKIPAGATKVLEIGCGGGQFAQRLRAANPGIGYTGIDISPANIDAAESLLPNEEFQLGNLWEYLDEAVADWDFVVSIACAFTCTDPRSRDELFELIDATSPKGFFILGSPLWLPEEWLEAKMTDALASSDSVEDSYYGGARDFLTDATVKGQLRPFYIHRSSSGAAKPVLKDPVRVVSTGRFNRVLGWQAAKKATDAGQEVPLQIDGVKTTGGLITSRESVDMDEKWVPKKG